MSEREPGAAATLLGAVLVIVTVLALAYVIGFAAHGLAELFWRGWEAIG